MSGFGVAEARVSSYEASYHVLVNRRGETAVADCDFNLALNSCIRSDTVN